MLGSQRGVASQQGYHSFWSVQQAALPNMYEWTQALFLGWGTYSSSLVNVLNQPEVVLKGQKLKTDPGALPGRTPPEKKKRKKNQLMITSNLYMQFK